MKRKYRRPTRRRFWWRKFVSFRLCTSSFFDETVHQISFNMSVIFQNNESKLIYFWGRNEIGRLHELRFFRFTSKSNRFPSDPLESTRIGVFGVNGELGIDSDVTTGAILGFALELGWMGALDVEDSLLISFFFIFSNQCKIFQWYSKQNHCKKGWMKGVISLVKWKWMLVTFDTWKELQKKKKLVFWKKKGKRNFQRIFKLVLGDLCR